MSEAMGGAIGLKLIAFLIVVITSYLAFTTIYSKAFRIKSDIVSIIEKNDGMKSSTEEEILAMLEKENYNLTSDRQCPNGSNITLSGVGVCVECVKTSGTLEGYYYRVRTFIDSKEIFGIGRVFDFITIKGETKVIYNSELSCQ